MGKTQKRYGFTLVELLVVLLILGVLVGLAVPRYMEAQKNARFRTFTANVREIQSTLEVYRMDKTSTGPAEYPDNLSELTSYFTQPPINPYTGKSMLSSNSEESGLQYQATGGKYKLCVVQRDVDDVNNNGVVEEVLPLSTKTACICNTQTSVGVTFTRNSVAYTSNGAQVGVNQPRFEQGKFGKAIMVEEGTIDGTRAAETLTIPTEGVLNPQRGEVAILRQMDIASNNPPSGVHRNIFSLKGVVWGIFVPNNTANEIRWAVGRWGRVVKVETTWDAKDWLWIFAEWDLPNATLHVYNVTKGTHASATITNAVSVTVPSSAYVGCADGVRFNAHCNGLIDDLRISSRARTDEEILSAYQSNQPLPVDAWTTLKLDFDGDLRTQSCVIP